MCTHLLPRSREQQSRLAVGQLPIGQLQGGCSEGVRASTLRCAVIGHGGSEELCELLWEVDALCVRSLHRPEQRCELLAVLLLKF